MEIWSKCDICGRDIPVGELCYGLKKGNCICKDCCTGFENCTFTLAPAPTLTPPNEPLTLEQLREMNETPIYVVTETYGSGWCILNWHGVNKSYTYFSRTGTSEGMTATPLSAKTYGDLWTAYLCPPEGEEETP